MSGASLKWAPRPEMNVALSTWGTEKLVLSHPCSQDREGPSWVTGGCLQHQRALGSWFVASPLPKNVFNTLGNVSTVGLLQGLAMASLQQARLLLGTSPGVCSLTLMWLLGASPTPVPRQCINKEEALWEIGLAKGLPAEAVLYAWCDNKAWFRHGMCISGLVAQEL